MFVGRKGELDRFEAVLARALTGNLALVMISGEPGIGKTRLAETFLARARDKGARTLIGRAWEPGGAPSFWPWKQALQAIDGHRVIAEDLGEREDVRFAAFDAVASFLAAAREPLVILLDDLHAADVATLRLLQFCARDPRLHRIVLIGTYRDGESNAVLDGIARDALHLRLRGLPIDDVATWLVHLVGAAPPEVVRTLCESTAGNPLFIDEMVGCALSEGGLLRVGSAGFRPPRLVREAIERQLVRLDDDTRALLAAAAVVGRPATPTFLQAISGASHDAVTHAREARVLVDDGDHVRFAHALLRDAAYATTPDLAALHRRVAAHLERNVDAPASELARHYEAYGDIERAIAAHRRAADRAMHAVAWEETIAHARRALELLDQDDVDLLLLLGRALLAAGERAEPTLARAFDLAPPNSTVRAKAALSLARIGEYMLMRPEKRRYLETAGRPPSDALHARVLARLGAELRHDDRSRARETFDEALRIARAVGDPATLTYVLDAYLDYGPDMLDERLALGTEIRDIARTYGDGPSLYDGYRWRLSALLERGDFARARVEAVEALAVAEKNRLPNALSNAVARLATIAYEDGRFDEGDRHARRVLDIELRIQEKWLAELMYAALRARSIVARGAWDDVDEILDAVAVACERLPRRRFLRALYAWVAVSAGMRDIAARELSALGPLATLPDDLGKLAGLAFALDAALLLGDDARAEEAAVALEPYRGRYAFAGTAACAGSIDALLLRARPAAPSAAVATTATFSREGALWAITLDGQTAHVRDARGMGFLARLLAEPQREVHALDFGDDAVENDLGPAIDVRARDQYRERIEDLRETIADAETHGQPARAERARRELEALSSELSRAFGLGGRARASGSSAERARMRVTVAIKRALAAIEKVHPRAAAHLKRAVRTGVVCAYDPDPRQKISWVVTT